MAFSTDITGFQVENYIMDLSENFRGYIYIEIVVFIVYVIILLTSIMAGLGGLLRLYSSKFLEY